MARGNQWMLFGIDMRHIGQHWLAAWRDLLFADGSPLRRRLDEPVALYGSAGVEVFQGGARAAGNASSGDEYRQSVNCEAVELPDELGLCRTISLPLAVEAEMAGVLAMEVDTFSPFTQDDTVFGYAEASRDERSLHLVLAIASRSAVNRWLHESAEELFDDQERSMVDEREVEVWVNADGHHVALKGFGESKRESLYRKRLQNVAAMLGGILLLALLSASVFAVHQKSRLQQAERLQAAVQSEAASVADRREILANANALIRASNAVHAEFPNPHIEIARLTELLTDDEFVTHLSIRGRDLRIRGRASDAAVVMQTLATTKAFKSVTAPQAITAVGNTGMEQFYLDVELAQTPQESRAGEEGGS
ncbi:MAG: hypothetical protein Cons2KO_06980 [Congregibacter sp.]